MTIASVASRGANNSFRSITTARSITCRLPSAARGYRHGLWVSQIGRRRATRYRHAGNGQRQLSWDNRDGGARNDLKKAMESVVPTTSRPTYADADKVKSWSDDLSELRPGRTLEEIESEAVDHALSRKTPGLATRAYKDVSADKVLKATTGTTLKTAPKVGDNGASKTSFTPKYEDVDTYANPADRNRQFTSEDAAVAAAAATAATETANYSAVHWNEPDGLPKPTAEELSKRYTDLGSYKAAIWNEPDGLPEKTSEEKSKKYSDLDKYKPISWNEPDGLQVKTAEERSKEYDDLDKYGPVRWNEPDGLQPKTAEELSKNYDDLHQYEAVRWHEPDGLPDPTPEELSKNYKDLDQYQAVAWHEPHGLRVRTPEEMSKQYDDLQAYAEPFDDPDQAIMDQQAREMESSVKGNPLAPKVDVATQPPVYEDTHQYGPVHWNEPDGLRKLTPEELSKNYDDLHLYGAVRWNEPDGLRRLTPEEESKKYKDLQGYGGNISPSIVRIHPEEASKAYSDLKQYGAFENSDARAPRIHPEEASKEYQDLGSYRPTAFDPIDTSYPMHPEEATKAYRDLGSYVPVWYNESGSEPLTPSNGLDSYDTREKLRISRNQGINYRDAEPFTADAIRARTLRNAAQSSQQHGVSQQTLTGNYARDFPEDFTQNWTQSHSSPALIPDHMVSANGQQPTEREDMDISSMDESFPSLDTKLQPALDRIGSPALSRSDNVTRQSQDPKHPKNEEIDAEKLESGPLIARHYGSAARSAPGWKAAKGSEGHSIENEPSMYKVLSWDHTAKSIISGEVSSSLSDGVSRSVADILGDVQNPWLFLPHFAALHEDGYELVDGSQGTLIFRKARSPGLPHQSKTRVCSVSQKPINPIDMMGKSALSSTTSPTGFVNYESLSLEDKLEPPRVETSEKPYPDQRSNTGGRKGAWKVGKNVATGVYWATPGALVIWLWLSNEYREKKERRAGLVEVMGGN